MVGFAASEMEGNKKMLDGSMIEWLVSHGNTVQRWADNNLAWDSRDDFFETALDSPFITYMLMKQYEMLDRQKLQIVTRKLKDKRGRIDLVVGAKGSGKTALAFLLADRLHDLGEDIWWFGLPTRLPEYIKSTMDFTKIPPNTTTIVDEASVNFFNRVRTQENIDIIRVLPLQRHSHRNFLVITQSIAISDLQFVRLADSIFYKTYSVFQDVTQRSKMRVKISDELKIYMPSKVDECLYYDTESIYSFRYSLPPVWKEEYSTPYSDFKSDYDFYWFITQLVDDLEDKDISVQCLLRGKAVDEVQVAQMRQIIESYGKDELLKMGKVKFVGLMKSGFDDTPLNELVKDYV